MKSTGKMVDWIIVNFFFSKQYEIEKFDESECTEQ